MITRRAQLTALATSVVVAVLLVGANATCASATTAEHLKLAWGNSNLSTFTLPSADNFEDSIQLNITSNRGGTVVETSHRLSGSGGAVFLASGSYPLSGGGAAWSTSPLFSDSGLTVGTWKLAFKVNGVTKTTEVRIGSGIAKSVKVSVPKAAVYNLPEAPHDFFPQIVAKDELGTSLPISSGTLHYNDPSDIDIVNEGFSSPSATTAGATADSIDVSETDPGTARVSVSDVQGPATSATPPSDSIHPTIVLTKITSISITPEFKTLYPHGATEVLDNIAVVIKDNAGVTLPITAGSESIDGTSSTPEDWTLSHTGETDESWNGLVGSSIDPGTFTVSADAVLADGSSLDKTVHIVVSPLVPVERTVVETYSGSEFTKKDIAGTAKCAAKGSALDCTSSAGKGDGMSITETVPAKVRKEALLLGYTASMALTVSDYSSSGGAADYTWASPVAQYGTETTIPGNGTWPDGPVDGGNAQSKVILHYIVNNGISLDLNKFSITYQYWTIP